MRMAGKDVAALGRELGSLLGPRILFAARRAKDGVGTLRNGPVGIEKRAKTKQKRQGIEGETCAAYP